MNKLYKTAITADDIIAQADQLRRTYHDSFREEIVRSVYNDAERISHAALRQKGRRYGNFDQAVDRFLTSPITGLPLMALILAVIFWVTIVGANYPSQMIATFLFWIEEQASMLFTSLGAPWWLTGFIWHGIYRGLAWVVAVMLPPMAIFFPLFTIFEDFGFLPRVAFNMDRLFKKCGAHGKQALTMSMGFGCNAAGIVATRIIDSPRERLIAILTNNFVPCNGRFPTLIMLGTVFVGANFHPAFASIAAAGSVMAIVGLGIIVTL
ncbi:MAG TPA: nucleoside recognition domain-containing protein, partial [Gammaproteobacteria bacterium]|nr:nucleoside recognition domain-containing protein [Gammaproteobacteria bacterium]